MEFIKYQNRKYVRKIQLFSCLFKPSWLYVREDIRAKLLIRDFPSAELFFIVINLYKKKWLISCSYNTHNSNIGKHLDIISRSLDTLCTKYENIVLLVDFNACVDDEALQTFCNS